MALSLAATLVAGCAPAPAPSPAEPASSAPPRREERLARPAGPRPRLDYRYTHPTYRFSLRPPKGWELNDDPDAGAAVEFTWADEHGIQASLAILTEMSLGRTLAECLQDQQAARREYVTGYRKMAERRLTIGGRPAIEERFEYQRMPDTGGPRRRSRVIAWYLLNGETLLTLRYEAWPGAFERYLPAVRATVASFRLVSGSPASR